MLRSALLLFFATMAVSAQADTQAALRVLRDECLGCHKPGKAKGGLLLNAHDKMMKGGDNGAAVVPGKPDESPLYQLALAEADPHMPPKKQLDANALNALKAWIAAGAPWDEAVFNEPPAPKAVKFTPMPEAWQPVLAMALSPDEKTLAVARAQRIALIDLAAKDTPVATYLEGHVEPVQSLAWTPDGRTLLSGGYQNVRVWDVAERKETRRFEDSLVGNVTALAATADQVFAADGEAGGAGFLRQFDLANGALLATWKAHDDNISSLRLSAKGDRLLSGGADKMARLWDTTTRKLIAFYEGHTNHVHSVAFNHDASQIATAGADREIKVWDVASREQDVSLGDKKSVYVGVSWTPDGKALAAVTDKGLGSVYTELQKHDGAQRSATAKERKLTSVGAPLTSVLITADAKTVFAGGFDGKIYRWNASDGKAEAVIEP
jgi:WD40 repeat protein